MKRLQVRVQLSQSVQCGLQRYVYASVSLTVSIIGHSQFCPLTFSQWALIELCRKPEKQQKLRDELSQFSGTDPSFDQLSTGLPYLDAVVQEVLRLHPPVTETTRIVRRLIFTPFFGADPPPCEDVGCRR